MSTMPDLIAELRNDRKLQRDLRNAEIFGILAEQAHVVPDEYKDTFAKLARLQEYCNANGLEFSIELITPPPTAHGLDRAEVVVSLPENAFGTSEPQQRRRKRGVSSRQDTPTLSEEEEEEEEEDDQKSPSLCSWQVIISTLLTTLALLYLNSQAVQREQPPRAVLNANFVSSNSSSTHLYQDLHVGNICAYPNAIRGVNSQQELTIGDLHGNAIKLVYFLLREGVLVGLSREDYARLCTVYHASPNAFREFAELLNRGARILSPHPKIRLLGDEFADRGSNDEYMLIVLDKLLGEGDAKRVEILLSNHGFEFYSYDQDDDMGRLNYKLLSNLPAHKYFSNSLHSFHHMVRDKSRAKRVLGKIYQDSLRLISYSSVAVEGNRSEVFIFTHAPIGIETLLLFSKDFRLPSHLCGTRAAMEANLLACMDAIQQTFDREIKHKIYASMKRSDSIMQFIWRRAPDRRTPATRPLHLTSSSSTNATEMVVVAWVHGHDGFEARQTSYGYCLDDEFGKDLSDVGAGDVGGQTYSVLIRLIPTLTLDGLGAQRGDWTPPQGTGYPL